LKNLFLLILFIAVANSPCKSQGYTNHWVMGYDSWAGIPFGGTNFDFQGGNLNVNYISRQMDFDFTNAVFCDSLGNLLFYSNGLYVSDAFGNAMPNGGGLNPGPFTTNFPKGLPLQQGNIVIPIPGETGKYFLFHKTCSYVNNLLKPLELLYSIIDMSLNNGLGDVVFKNSSILQDTLVRGELGATKHANGRDWWLITHAVNSSKFYKLLITPFSILVSSQNYGTWRNLYPGCTDFSPDGSKFAQYNPDTGIDIFDFDRCSGLFSNYINIPINDSAIMGSVVFSPNSKILYVTSINYIYQFDLTASNIPLSMKTVAIWDSTYSPHPPFATTFLMGELGPDNKVYVNCANSTLTMHVINYPDSLNGYDIQQHSIQLPSFNAFTIPNHPNYYLGSLPGSPCDSLTAVNEIANNTIHIRINPNPAQNTFYLNSELPYDKTAIATIYNTLGEPVICKNLYWYFGYLQIDCSKLNNGVYIVKVETNEYGGSAKLVIAR